MGRNHLVAKHPVLEQTITYEDLTPTKDDDEKKTTNTPDDNKESPSPSNTNDLRRPLSDWTHNNNIYGLDLMNHHETKLTVMVRLDVNGNGSLVIPYESAFNDDVDSTTEKRRTRE